MASPNGGSDVELPSDVESEVQQVEAGSDGELQLPSDVESERLDDAQALSEYCSCKMRCASKFEPDQVEHHRNELLKDTANRHRGSSPRPQG